MSLLDDDEFLEFVHGYDDGDKVVMRGLYAASFVVKKYKMSPEEVIAFSSWQGNHKATTVFHFHPDFERENLRSYMENHTDGKALLEEVRAERDGLSGWEWLEAVRSTGVWSEVFLAAALAVLNPIGSLVMSLVDHLSKKVTALEPVEAGVSARSLSLATPPVPEPFTAKFPVIHFPKSVEHKVEGISDELALLTASQAIAVMREPVSTAIH